MKPSVIARLLFALAAVFFVSCSTSTTLVSSWHDKAYPSGSLKRPIVLAVANKPTVRTKLEDAIVLELRRNGVDATSSYAMFPETRGLTAASITLKLRETDRDSVLISHLVDVKTETVVVPAHSEVYDPHPSYPAYYDRFNAYYAESYSVVYRPGYTYEYKTYVLETNLYDLKTDRLVWTGLTNSEEPTDLDAAVKSFAGVVVADIEKRHVF